MPTDTRLAGAGFQFVRQSGSPAMIMLCALTRLALAAYLMTGPVFLVSSAHAQPVESGKLQLRKIKIAAEKLNEIASSAPDMIRAMFAGNTPSATCSRSTINQSPRKPKLRAQSSRRRRVGH